MNGRFALLLVLLLTLLAASALRHASAFANPFPLTPNPLPEQIARAHLLANAAAYGVTPADLAHLRLDLSREDPITGARYVVFLQTVDGIPIHNAVVNVTLLPDGEVLHVGNRAHANVAARAESATPTLTHAEAIARAAELLGLAFSADTVVQRVATTDSEQEARFTGGDLSLEELPVKLAYFPIPDGSLRLAWNLHIYQRDAVHWWNLHLDAATGELLDKSDWVIHDSWESEERRAKSEETRTHEIGPVGGRFPLLLTPYSLPIEENAIRNTEHAITGTYRVYPIPIESPSHSTPPSPADGRMLVADPDLSSASPFGWHDTDGLPGAEYTTTQGNNSYAYLDLDANGIPDSGSSPDGGPGLLFDFPIDLTQPPSAYRPAVVTDYFYWTNLIHDVAYHYGFNEAARNFQENNYGNGGLGSDYVYAEAQDGSGTNGGTFSVGPDGTNPRMQMYIWTPATPDRDGALDHGVVTHEYGHGIANRMTGNGSTCLGNPEAMLEGWADWQAVWLTMRQGDTATTNRPLGTYVLGQPPTGPGIRPAPYTTDFAVNDYTYADLPAAAIPHGVGFIWNTMLWEMNWELIAAHGFNPDIYGAPSSGGNNLAYKLVMDGLAIQPCNPGFVDGRNAILAADIANTGGANECRIWAAFARRGLGFSASQGSPNSTTDGTAAFDLPPQCEGLTPTPTPVPPTSTPTVTPLPTNTATPPSPTQTPTATGIPATGTPTATPVLVTVTATATALPATVTPSPTAILPTSTPTVVSPTSSPTVTTTGSPSTATPTGTSVPPTVTVSTTQSPETPRLHLPLVQHAATD